MKQSNLEAVHNGIAETVQLWASGLITDREFAAFMAEIHADFKAYANPTATKQNLFVGLLDPNTGLRYM